MEEKEQVETYEPPVVIATFAIEELRRDAACATTPT